MKKFFIATLVLASLALVFTSCSSITGGGSENKEELYKAAIERYYRSIINLDIDDFLDSLDPLGPLYPDAASIEQLRAEADKSAQQGEVEVKELITLEESATWARVQVTLFLSIDFSNSGEPFEETFYPTFELTLKDGTWRIFNGSMQ